MRYTGRVPGRPRQAAPEVEQPTEPDHSAEAWCAIYERKSAIRCVVPEYEDEDDAETIRKATRTAHLRATDRDPYGRLRWRGP